MSDLSDEQKQLLIDYNITFHSEHGARVLVDLKRFCGYNDSCYSRGEPDHTALLLGQRNVALRIQNFLERSKEERQEVTINE